jgi:DNA mismatch repair protein MutL
VPQAALRNPIHQLPPGLVNRIAAGEVIERPASVVKELVENAIDAGAHRIDVEIEDGGRSLIRIIDDGSGIPPEELPLAFASHATSKLCEDDDLFRIATMGFRGEALASIGAVSHTRLLSRTPDQDIAWEIHNRGGVIDSPQSAAGNTGTVVEVRNLFYNTPARRKFLKGAPTEIGHISETLLRLAIPHPHIHFSLKHNSRKSLELPISSAEQRWLAAWPEEFAEQRLPLDVRDAELQLVGLIGLPELARPIAKYQFLYLNGRPIRDRFIQHALREAYRGLTEPGRQPAAILLLTVPPQDVDVNVHPTKSEVRFRDGSRIHSLVLSGIREKLLGADLAPSAIPFRSPVLPVPQRDDLRQKLADFFKGAIPEPIDSEKRVLSPLIPPDKRGQAEKRGQEGLIAATLDGVHAFPPSASPANENQQRDQFGLDSLTNSAQEKTPDPFNTPSTNPAAPRGPLPASTPAIQLHNSYLVAESEDGLIIIDQHALHERIMYEDLLARVSRGPLESQHMLIPPTLPATGRQQEMLDQIRPLLQRLGIHIASISPTAVAVQAFPSFLERLDPLDFVADLLERGEQETLDLNQEELLHEILDMMACKAAVKAGDPLSAAEIEALLVRRHLVDRSSNCPHGRPTTLRLTLRDLEKQFKRTGF